MSSNEIWAQNQYKYNLYFIFFHYYIISLFSDIISNNVLRYAEDGILKLQTIKPLRFRVNVLNLILPVIPRLTYNACWGRLFLYAIIQISSIRIIWCRPSTNTNDHLNFLWWRLGNGIWRFYFIWLRHDFQNISKSLLS